MARTDWNRPPLAPLGEGLRRIRMTVSYDGAGYHGWQSQENGVSVQQRIEEALLAMLGEQVDVQGSGRTDSGVHALGQVCHFDIRSKVPVRAFKPRLNHLLPPDIRVMEAEEVDGSFHARFTTMAREYRYLVKQIDDVTAFDHHRIYAVKELPSMELLEGYAACIQGTHDFSTFCAAGDLSPSKFRDIYVSKWTLDKDSYGYGLLTYTICGNAFLYHMVRSLVGTQLDCAHQGLSVQAFREILDSKDRGRAGRTAPSEGLYLARISYDPDEYAWFEER